MVEYSNASSIDSIINRKTTTLKLTALVIVLSLYAGASKVKSKAYYIFRSKNSIKPNLWLINSLLKFKVTFNNHIPQLTCIFIERKTLTNYKTSLSFHTDAQTLSGDGVATRKKLEPNAKNQPTTATVEQDDDDDSQW